MLGRDSACLCAQMASTIMAGLAANGRNVQARDAVQIAVDILREVDKRTHPEHRLFEPRDVIVTPGEVA